MANVELATAYVTLIPSMQGAQGKIAEALMPAGAEGEKAGKNAGGMFAGGFGGVLGAAAIGVAAAGAAVAGAAVGLYKVGAVFDDVTDTIRVGTGASGAALDGLVGIAQQVGAEVPVSFEKAGSTVADLNTRLGLSGDTLSTVAQQYIQAGNILGQDVDITSTTAAFSAFGIEGANVEGAMDSLFRVSQATGVGMNELASTVQTNAVPMQNLGFSFEETAALAGSLDKAGLNTSQTMASMGKSLVTLAKAGEEPEAAFKRTTGEIGEFIKTGDTAGALNLASKVFGTKGATAFVGALQSGKINLDDLTASAGMTSDTILGLGKETADAAESWQMIKNKALIALEPMGTAVFNLAGKGLGFLNERMDGVIETVSNFGAAAAGGLSGVMGILAKGDFDGPIFGMEEDSKFIDFLFDAREAVINLWSGLTMGGDVRAQFAGQMSGLVAIGASIRGIFDQIGPSIAPLIPQMFALFQALSPTSLIFQALLPILPQLAAAIGGVVGQVLPLAMSLASQLIPIITQLISGVLPPLVSIFGNIIAAIAPLITQIAGLLIPIIIALMPVVVNIFGTIAAVIVSVMQIIQGVIQVVTGIISGNWSQVWSGIGNIFAGVWNTIVAVVSGAISHVGAIISGGLGLVLGVVGSILGSVGSFFADTWNNIINGVSSMIGAVVGFFGGLIGKIMGAIGDAGSALFSVGVNIIQGLIDGIGSMMGSIGRAVLNIVPQAIRGPFEQLLGIRSPSRVFMGYGVNIGQGLINGMDGMQGKISSSVEGMVTVPAVPAFSPTASAGSLAEGEGSAASSQAAPIERIVLDIGGEQVFARIVRNGERKLVRA